MTTRTWLIVIGAATALGVLAVVAGALVLAGDDGGSDDGADATAPPIDHAAAIPCEEVESGGTGAEAARTLVRLDDEPLRGACLTIVDGDGDVVAAGAPDGEGEIELALPGPGRYVARLELIDGVGVRGPAAEGLGFDVRPGQVRPLLFPLEPA